MAKAFQMKCSPKKATSPNYEISPSSSDLIDVVGDRVSNELLSNYDEVLVDGSYVMSLKRNMIDTTQYILGVRRFDDNESKSPIIKTIEEDVIGDAEWYEIQYHSCENDRDNDVMRCPDWTTEVSYGSVPGDV